MLTTRLCTRFANAPRGQRGYTLIETLMVASIMAVLTSASLPGMKGFFVAAMANSQITDFTSALRFARAQAMARGEEVTLCARPAEADDAAPVCQSTGQDWSAGWVVFVDRGTRGQLDATDQVLRVHQRPANAGPVTAPQRSITFHFNGISAKANTTVRFSPPGVDASDKTAQGTQVVCINKPGKARIVAAAACGR